MGVKKINHFWLIQNGVMTSTNTLLSSAQNLQNFDNAGLEITWTGTPTGTLSVQGSCSAACPEAPAITYYDLTFNPVLAQPAGAAGGYLIDLNQFPFPYMKVKYINVSGSGVLNVYLFSKDVN